MERHDIAWALNEMHFDKAVCRRGWNGHGQYLSLHKHPVSSKMLPWISITTVQGDVVPWTCSQTDLMAEDWELCDA